MERNLDNIWRNLVEPLQVVEWERGGVHNAHRGSIHANEKVAEGEPEEESDSVAESSCSLLLRERDGAAMKRHPPIHW